VIKYIYILSIVIFSSCEYFKAEDSKKPIARVNDSYLYEEDIEKLISENTSAEDSTLIVNNYINRWATQQLLIDKAKLNLSEEKLDQYKKLVNDYKKDLYTKGYKDAIVTKQLDSSISELEFEKYYEQNKENFKLNEKLLKLRYIHLPLDYSNIQQVKKSIQKFDNEDKIELEEIAIQFKSYFFNDSIWIKQEVVTNEIPLIVIENKLELLKKSNYVQLQDSIGVYLIQIVEVLERNQLAPLEFVRPTLEQIILNKRKLELIKKLETDITKDAKNSNDFEIYQ